MSRNVATLPDDAQNAQTTSSENNLLFFDASSSSPDENKSSTTVIHNQAKGAQRKRGRGGNRQGIERHGGLFTGRSLSLSSVQAAREARIEWKFGQIVRNMKLEQISECIQEDMVSTSSSQFEDFQSDFGSPHLSTDGQNPLEGSEILSSQRARILATPISEFEAQEEVSIVDSCIQQENNPESVEQKYFESLRVLRNRQEEKMVNEDDNRSLVHLGSLDLFQGYTKILETNSCNEFQASKDMNDTNIFNRVYLETKKSFNNIVHYIIVNIIVVVIRMIEACWLIGLALVARGLRWQLDVLKWILKSAIQGICCIGCFGCYGCLACVFGRKSTDSKGDNQSSTKRARRKSKSLSSSMYENGDSTSDSDNTGPQPLLIFINLDKVLVYSSKIAPQFHLPFKKKNSPPTSIPFKITVPNEDTVKQGKAETASGQQEGGKSMTALFIHPRPFLPQFLENLHQMGKQVEVAIYSNQSKAFVDEVLRWIDGYSWCHYRFYNDGNMRGSLHRDTDYLFKKVKQIRSLRAQNFSTSLNTKNTDRLQNIDTMVHKNQLLDEGSPTLQNRKKDHHKGRNKRRDSLTLSPEEQGESSSYLSSDDQSFQSLQHNESNEDAFSYNGAMRILKQASHDQKSDSANSQKSEFKEAKKLIKSISNMCDKIEDEIRDHELVQECMEDDEQSNSNTDCRTIATDLIRSQKYLKEVQNPVQKRVILIDDEPQKYSHSTYQKNLISIKPWRNDNQRDHVLKDCLAIIKQMRHSKNVSKDLPQFVELYNSLIEE